MCRGTIHKWWQITLTSRTVFGSGNSSPSNTFMYDYTNIVALKFFSRIRHSQMYTNLKALDERPTSHFNSIDWFHYQTLWCQQHRNKLFQLTLKVILNFYIEQILINLRFNEQNKLKESKQKPKYNVIDWLLVGLQFVYQVYLQLTFPTVLVL